MQIPTALASSSMRRTAATRCACIWRPARSTTVVLKACCRRLRLASSGAITSRYTRLRSRCRLSSASFALDRTRYLGRLSTRATWAVPNIRTCTSNSMKSVSTTRP